MAKWRRLIKDVCQPGILNLELGDLFNLELRKKNLELGMKIRQ